MKIRANAVIAAAVLVCLIPATGLALVPYSQDFEGYALPSPGALMGDDWLVFGNVFFLDWSYWFGYGPYAAPNDGAAFCAVATGEGGPSQGSQQLSVYNDYNNTNLPTAYVEANVFHEQTIGAGDVGETWVFDFDAKLGNLGGVTTAAAFIKILNPADWSVIFIPLDMTTIPSSWGSYSLSALIDPTWSGRILQFGFASTATNYEPSGVFYDNIRFYPTGAVSVEEESWGGVKALFR